MSLFRDVQSSDRTHFPFQESGPFQAETIVNRFNNLVLHYYFPELNQYKKPTGVSRKAFVNYFLTTYQKFTLFPHAQTLTKVFMHEVRKKLGCASLLLIVYLERQMFKVSNNPLH